MENQLVVFQLAQEHYGVDIAAVEGIIKMQTITKMPHTPEFVEGVTNLRGVVVPVVDLRRRFGLPAQEADRDTRIMVVFMGSSKIGMIVDAVSQVLRIPEEAVEPPPPMITSVNSAFIKGIAKLENQLVILLDLAKVLNTVEKESILGIAA